MFGSSKKTHREEHHVDTQMVPEPIPLDPHPVEHDPRPGMHPHDRTLISPQAGDGHPQPMPGQPEPLAQAHRQPEMQPPMAGHSEPAMHPPMGGHPSPMAGQAQPAMQSPGLDGLEPVMSPDEAQRLRSQWDQLQIRFVEDPRGAVTEARTLVHGSLDRLTQRLQMRTQVLERGMSQQGEASTETLRLALKGYRELLEHVIAFGQK